MSQQITGIHSISQYIIDITAYDRISQHIAGYHSILWVSHNILWISQHIMDITAYYGYHSILWIITAYYVYHIIFLISQHITGYHSK